jgi:phage shock protein A
MGIFSRMKRAVKSKANAAVDKAISPEKELDMAILELKEQRDRALGELLSYKTTAKQMEQDIERYAKKSAEWEKRAMAAVKAGDDEMAKEALKEKKHCAAQVVQITRDRDEAAGYAIELNRSRKQVETKLRILELKKGTMATQIAAARSGGGDAFGNDNEVWDRFDRAEDKIDEEAIAAEVHAAMEGEELSETDFDARLLQAGAEPASGADDELARLKAKMEADRHQRLEAARSRTGRALGDGTGEQGDDGKAAED